MCECDRETNLKLRVAVKDTAEYRSEGAVRMLKGALCVLSRVADTV